MYIYAFAFSLASDNVIQSVRSFMFLPSFSNVLLTMLEKALRCGLGHCGICTRGLALLDGGAALDKAAISVRSRVPPLLKLLLGIGTLLSVARGEVSSARLRRAAWAQDAPVVLLVVGRCHHCPINAFSLVEPGAIYGRFHC